MSGVVRLILCEFPWRPQPDSWRQFHAALACSNKMNVQPAKLYLPSRTRAAPSSPPCAEEFHRPVCGPHTTRKDQRRPPRSGCTGHGYQRTLGISSGRALPHVQHVQVPARRRRAAARGRAPGNARSCHSNSSEAAPAHLTFDGTARGRHNDHRRTLSRSFDAKRQHGG